MKTREELKELLRKARKLEAEGHCVIWSNEKQNFVVISQTEGG